MNKEFEDLAARAAPAVFVVLWSTGFIGTQYVLHNAEPLTYLAIRMALVVGLMAIMVAIARPQWPDRIWPETNRAAASDSPRAWVLPSP